MTNIVDEAIQGLIDGGFTREQAESARFLLNMIYRAGKTEGMQETYVSKGKGCQICGVTGITGYVCNNPSCPTRVTCA